MLVDTTPRSELTSIEEYRQERTGYQDRANGYSLENTTSRAYCRGYCDRIIFEIDRDSALETYHA